ncbi:MAG TPA: PatB family C-S lyase [Patescibacteria group bacterium]|nr:PatB family C-S lyase [Patescibacteria group bacterium]
MQYNFDEIIDRRKTNALNTDGFRGYIFKAGPEMQFPYGDEDFVRMWVADMEFATPPEVCQAIRDRVDRRIFGYSMVFDADYYEAFSDWCRRRYDWSFSLEQLMFTPGVIPALYELTGDLTAPDEKLLITTPAYGYFKHAATFNQRELVCSPLKNDNGWFTIDFADLEQKAADPKVKLLLWCNPHNPSGRMWTEEETKRVGAIAEKYGLWLVSDEIHCDLIRQGKTHIPTAKVLPDYPKLITCMAASKTFNLAGLMFSNLIVRDAAVRKQIAAHDKLIGLVNPLSLTASQAAYQHGGEWLEQLRTYLDDNFRLVTDYLATRLPAAVCRIPEATYLAWVDLNRCLPDVEDLPMFFAQEAGVLLEGGDGLFVGNAQGFVRLNLAMPRAIIEKGLRRMCDAIDKHNGGVS